MTTSYKISNNISQNIFRAYDIRGIVGESFTPDNIYTIALAIGSEAQKRGEKNIIIGRDGRLSGPELLQALSSGLLASGCNVINIGEVTTPILYYATNTLGIRSGIMLTGSHNPPNYNGIKIVLGGETLFGDAILGLHQRIVVKNFVFGSGNETQKEIIDDYIKRIVSDVKLAKPLKVVIDCGNGVGGKVAPKLFRALECEVTELFCNVDGNFPNHHPDPSLPENLVDLIKKVKEVKADVGFAFDGDADRVGLVTSDGEIIEADRLLMLLAEDLLTRQPNATITYDVKCTRNLALEIKKLGGNPIMGKTGHSFVKAKMKEVNALLAGEFSGHIFIKERWFGFDDGIYAASRLAEIIAKKNQSTAAIFAALPKSVNTPELKLPMADDKKFAFMDKLVAKTKFDEGKVTTIDGIRVDFKDGFGLARPSNTTPYIILRFEADTADALKRIQNIFREKLLALEPNLQLPF